MKRATILAFVIALALPLTTAGAVKIAFDVPDLIKSSTTQIKFKSAQIVDKNGRPDYTISAQIVSSGDNGLVLGVWVTGMNSDTAQLSERCIAPECKIVPPPATQVWDAFIDAFNRMLIRNPEGFGHSKPIRCVDPALNYTDVVLESKIEPDLSWPRFRLAHVGRPEASYLSYELTRYASRIARFVPNNKDPDLRDRALKEVQNRCGKTALGDIRFIPQFGFPRPRPQTTAPNAGPLK